MDEFMSVLTKSNDIDEAKLKDHLRKAVSQDVYDKWIEHFVFEEITDDEIIIGYYGSDSLRKFEKKYKKMVWLEICSYIGCVKKLNISKRKKQAAAIPSEAPAVMMDYDVSLNHFEEAASAEISFDEPVVEAVASNKKNKTPIAIFQNPWKTIRVLIIFGIIAGILAVSTLFGMNHISNKTFVENIYNVGNIKVNEKVRIIQISDLHTSTYGKDNSQLIDRVKKLKPDAIIYTGDCIEPNEESVKATIKLCSSLAETAPSYYVYGNNEIDWVYGFYLTKDTLDEKFGFDDDNRNPDKLLEMKDGFQEQLEKAGVNVLKNEKDTIVVGTTKVDIYGSLTSNPSAFWHYSEESFGDFLYKDSSNVKVFAIHEPFVFEELDSDFWGDLMLCGHTHGGVIKVPVLGPLYTQEGGLFPERNECFVSGRYSFSGKHLIVSPGLDNSSMFRINNEPELTIIDMNRF